MSDFDAFEDSAPQQTEVDPAAEFLAREQDELKGLEDDNFGESAPTEDQGQGQADDFDPFGGEQQQQQPLSDSPQPAEPEQQYGYSGDFDDTYDQDFGRNDTYSAVSQVDKLRAEPEKIRLWREENERRIVKKDEEESKRMEEWRDIAKKELDDWYKHHEEQLSKTKENNRESEAAFVAERDQTQPGEEWEKICRLCEFNPKNSKNTKDISRMRSILLQLKQTPLVR